MALGLKSLEHEVAALGEEVGSPADVEGQEHGVTRRGRERLREDVGGAGHQVRVSVSLTLLASGQADEDFLRVTVCYDVLKFPPEALTWTDPHEDGQRGRHQLGHNPFPVLAYV